MAEEEADSLFLHQKAIIQMYLVEGYLHFILSRENTFDLYIAKLLSQFGTTYAAHDAVHFYHKNRKQKIAIEQ